MELLREIRLAFLVLVLLFCGCGPYHGTQMTKPPLERHENLVYLDYALATKIPCETLKGEKLASGRTRIYARFFNKQNHTAECQIQIKFKNADGRVIDQTGWMPFLLPRREVVEFEHVSLTSGINDFTLLLRAAR